MRSRYYSDQPKSSEDPKPAEESEKDEVEVSVEAELGKKLKEEEAKVADCMVRASLLQSCASQILILPAEPVTIPSGRLP